MKKSLLLSIIISQLIFFLSLPMIHHLFSYIHPLAFVVIWAVTTFCTTFIVLAVKGQKVIAPYSLFISIMIVYTASLLVLLFIRPGNQNYDNWNMTPFNTVRFFMSGRVPLLVEFYNLVANVVLFIPYGFFLLELRKRLGISIFSLIFYPLLCISMIEILQHLTKRGSLDIDDVILNMCGVLIGYALYPLFHKVIKIKSKTKKPPK
ncbi:VanZ family protein [Falsibacillus pallidus]|uniref:VanZ like protein n=1 Tax=Falsibacillus pallidus TaxID=493781 RepID=A0A370GPK4_9BACI|nr:VanZ family protein [Falsibacillus pallidus]RDI45461.1 VanZ like protein [Falsibacillus pallidus]